MQYLYQQHAQNPVVLENEPKCLDLGRLNVPRITARLARASILGHNKILWAAGSGYARQGEEIQDLGNGADEEMSRPAHGESVHSAVHLYIACHIPRIGQVYASLITFLRYTFKQCSGGFLSMSS